eukprot:138626-Chlamydomonas_euryale.AAC.5
MGWWIKAGRDCPASDETHNDTHQGAWAGAFMKAFLVLALAWCLLNDLIGWLRDGNIPSQLRCSLLPAGEGHRGWPVCGGSMVSICERGPCQVMVICGGRPWSGNDQLPAQLASDTSDDRACVVCSFICPLPEFVTLKLACKVRGPLLAKCMPTQPQRPHPLLHPSPTRRRIRSTQASSTFNTARSHVLRCSCGACALVRLLTLSLCLLCVGHCSASCRLWCWTAAADHAGPKLSRRSRMIPHVTHRLSAGNTQGCQQ